MFDMTKRKGGVDASALPVSRMQINFSRASITDDITINLPNCAVDVQKLVQTTNAINPNTNVTIRAHQIVGGINTAKLTRPIYNMTQGANNNFDTLTLLAEEGPLVAGSQTFYDCTFLRVLGTPWEVPAIGTGSNRKFTGTRLTEIYFVPNAISSGGSFGSGVLIDDALVSLANALKGGLETPQSLTFVNTTTKEKCNTILGTVSQVTEGGETYDFFTSDPNGTTTLTEFITLTKGWTLA